MKSLFNKFKKTVAANNYSKSDASPANKFNLKLTRISLHSNPNHILCASYDPIQHLLALGTSHGTIHILGKLGVEHVMYLNDRDLKVVELTFLVNRGLLCGVCEKTDHKEGQTVSFICVWSLKSHTLKFQINVPRHRAHIDRITCLLHPTPLSKFLLIGTRDGHILAFNFVKRWFSSYQMTPLQDKQVNCMEMHPNSSALILTGHSGGYCSTYDLASKSKDLFSVKGFFHDVVAISWHPSKEFFASAFANGSIMIWNRKQRSVVQRIPFFEQIGRITDLYWIKKDIIVNVNDLDNTEHSTHETVIKNLDVRFDDDQSSDEEEENLNHSQKETAIDEEASEDVPASEFVVGSDDGDNVSPKFYVPSGDEGEFPAPEKQEQPAVDQTSLQSAEDTGSFETPTSPDSPAQPLSPSPKTPVPTSPQQRPSSIASQDREEFSSQISGLYKLTLTPDFTKSSSSRINRRNGTQFLMLAPDQPWKITSIPQFAGIITRDDRHFHILDLREGSFCRVGTCVGESVRSMFILKSTNFPSLFQSLSGTAPSPRSPSHGARQNWPLCGGEPAAFPPLSSDSQEAQHHQLERESDLVLTLGESGVVLWGMNAALGRVQRLFGLHKQKHEVLSFVPWSSVCLLSAIDDNSLSFVYLKTMEEKIVDLSPKDYLRTVNGDSTKVRITCMLPMQSMNIVLVGFSNGIVLGVSAEQDGQCVFRGQISTAVAITSIDYSQLESMTFLIAGDVSGQIHVFQFNQKQSESAAAPLYSLAVQENSPLRHLFVFSKDGNLANQSDQNDLPPIVSSQIANTNTKGAQIITLNAHLNRKQTPLPPIHIYSENENLKVVCPVVVKFHLKNGGISIASGPVMFSIKGEDSRSLIWAELGSLDVLVGHTSASTGKLINLKMPLEKGECLDGKETIFFVHDVAQSTYRLYAGIKLLGVCRYDKADAPPNDKATGVQLIPRDAHKEYKSTQKFLQSIFQEIQIYYDAQLSLKDMRFNNKNADIDCVFSTEHHQDGPFVLVCCSNELKLFRLQRSSGELQLQRSAIFSGHSKLRDAQFSSFHKHNSVTVLKTDGSIEVFSVHKTVSLERVHTDSLVNSDMIRSEEVPSHISISDDGRILAVNKNYFLHCALLKPNESRQIQQPQLHLKRTVPRKPTTLSQGIKGFLSGTSTDSTKLDQLLNQVDIDNRFLKLVDVDEESERHLSKEFVEEKHKANSRFIQGFVPQSKEDSDLDAYRKELLGKHQIDESQTPVRGDTSKMAGELDDTRALVSQARDKALERGERLQKLEESTREMMLSAQTFAEKAARLKEKSRGGFFG
mmetsp:Transcript_9198/g.33952  ORF Transcript_9198/g.33952 Transcript_9198/m.33952 type:complete len:1308 (-) Transcript_9198:2027-5950(-)